MCKTPKIHREDLLLHVHRPELIRVIYPELDASIVLTSESILRDLETLHSKLTMNAPDTEELWLSYTRSLKTLEKFYNKARYVAEQLGDAAADYFIQASIRSYRESVKLGTTEYMGLVPSSKSNKKVDLSRLLSEIVLPKAATAPSILDTDRISPKADCLIDTLLSHYEDDFRGIIFAQQRAEVASLTWLLSHHPRTRDRFRIGSFIGTSNNASRKVEIGDLLQVKAQVNTLDDFRDGTKNLVIATSVLEEGIDISACNIVICFEKPPNLKSFIQRRGRARKAQSKLVLMLQSSDAVATSRWHDLEDAMTRAYMDDSRAAREAAELEEDDELDERVFKVSSTG